VGRVEVRHTDGTPSFRAPDFVRAGEVDEETLDRAVGALRVDPSRVVRVNWIDNGPGWLGVQLASANDVLALAPDFVAMRGIEVGVIGAYDEAGAGVVGAAYEVRAFCPDFAVPEDPVTGSLNAGFALWLTRAGHLPSSYVVRQGTALGRDGRVVISTDESGGVWVGGATRTIVRGTVDL
jgi:PhzF family phenazine biosynthesis protein